MMPARSDSMGYEGTSIPRSRTAADRRGKETMAAMLDGYMLGGTRQYLPLQRATSTTATPVTPRRLAVRHRPASGSYAASCCRSGPC